ncbi:hypothetical protein MITS9509_02713 [Synechococcus sp. MIT S9509]|uniref:hypothetical protein n=1 Tax=unclassified Synechococcus TaxID=2626047 RepID=UPI0007BC826D|nr:MULTISPECIES: hypothetical protein [unclassified Synechococcus]KZR85529.1 hypothetical protein MITS9504_02066 [Synechococcus sp. MIT S9504]KZR90424.1 hypothetical protein MITS9509_02713 [Synechococcus sp. MIT S9509]
MAKFRFDPVAGLRLQREFLGDYCDVPYVIAIAPDDGIWITNNGGSHLHIGNQLIRIDQNDGSLETFDVGTHSGP